MNPPENKTCIHPYLFFNGRCEEALEFYQSAIGATVGMVMRFKDAPDPPPEGTLAPGFEDKVMHACFYVGSSMMMASDGCGEPTGFEGFALSLTLPDEAACQNAFGALAEGGEIRMPLGKTFWSPCFGMVQDKFGMGWMITVPEA
jgi:PhnB protein